MSRSTIYYWKCDRPAAFYGTQVRVASEPEMERALWFELCRYFGTQEVVLSAGAGQGNHLTWNAEVTGESVFVRVENGPENDTHLAVESRIVERMREIGIPTPELRGCDVSRSRVPFAWQVMERIPFPDLNHWFKQGVLETQRTAYEIGQFVGRWQSVRSPGFGVFDGVRLHGFHATYADYFFLRLDDHLSFLVDRGFLSAKRSQEIESEIHIHRELLDIDEGCFVHKDLALWNILGARDQIAAFIDFDDSVSGDPMDDFSLLACFHDSTFLERAFDGYQSVRMLPKDHLRRLWLHMLRNMLVKAVIRVGAGYFDRGDGFFLINSGTNGAALREMTLARLDLALLGLRESSRLDILSP